MKVTRHTLKIGNFGRGMSERSVRRALQSFPKSDWIIWVGAGVSCTGPSCLPLGVPLTEFAIDVVFGSHAREILWRTWEHANRIAAAPGMTQPFGPAPRLETVLGVIETVEKCAHDCRFSFLSGFGSLEEAPYNLNHLCLAKLISDGATVITTNFDTCIEAAFAELMGPAGQLRGKKVGNVYRFASELPNTGTLWHAHGVAHDLANLGATIRAVKLGLATELSQELDQALSRRALLAFVGYGAGDSFDVTPFFAGKAPGLFARSCGLFLQHGTSPTPVGAGTLLQPFGERLKLNVDTAAWLLDSSGLGTIPSSSMGDFDWRQAFLAKIDLTDYSAARPFAICRLARELGLSYETIEATAYRQACALAERFDSWEVHRTLAFNCRMRGKSGRERHHDLLAGDSRLLGYNYSKGNLRKAKQSAKPLDILFKESSDPTSELDWSTYTSMSSHCRPFVRKLMIKPFIRGLGPRDTEHAKKLLELAERLGDRPLKNVTYLNQVATAMRFSLLLRALLFGETGEEVEQKILYLYREASSIQGYVSAYRDFAIKRILLARLFDAREQYNEAIHYVKKSAKLAQLISDTPGRRRARYIGVLIYLHKLFR